MSDGREDDWFDQAPCGLIATALDGTIVDANSTLLDWVGRTRASVLGLPFLSILDPGSRLFFESRYLQVLHLNGRVDEVAITLLGADGVRLPVLVNSWHDVDAGVVRTAVFNASERTRYERDLLDARRAAEASAERVRVLQEASSLFGSSATDRDVAEGLASIARSAFGAREAAVLLTDDRGALELAGGTDPLEGSVAARLRVPKGAATTVEYAHTADAELASAMKASRLASLSVTPLVVDDERLGVLVCSFGRRTAFDDEFSELQQALSRQAAQTLVRVRLQRRLAFLALHDQLTGAANRQLLEQSLDEAIGAAARRGEPLSVLFLDLDDFKSINDAFGHAVGDIVLVELAARLRDGVRAGDVVGRIGGDEFVVICPSAEGEAAVSVAERILATAGNPLHAAGAEISISVSIGVSLYRPDADPRPTAEQMLVRADGAMYRSKRAGKRRATVEPSG